MKILTVVGARPQFIKASPVSRAISAAGHQEFLVHTGQHYDDSMSAVFFRELGIPQPDLNLEIGSGSHGVQTGRMLAALEEVMLAQKPDMVLVYGDTNSTLAASLAACKIHIPIAHVEAGLRSFNRAMPEEHNRVLTDHCSELLFCPTQTGVDQLARENLTAGVHLVGDTMYDAVLSFSRLSDEQSTVLADQNLTDSPFYLGTCHRPYNTDDPAALAAIMDALEQLDAPVVFPVHPRTRGRISDLKRPAANQVRLLEPVGYLDMLALERAAKMILTDSGGIQKEAYWFETPCITLRTETEWVETVNEGWNTLVGANTAQILEAVSNFQKPESPAASYGDGRAAELIVDIILKHLKGQHTPDAFPIHS